MEETIFNELNRVFSYNSGAEDVIRVVLVCKREAMREGLRQMLNGDDSIKVIGEAKNEREALHQVQKLCPEFVILDAEMHGIESLKTLNSIKQSSDHINIIVISDERNSLVSAIESGVVAFLSRDVSRNELISAIRVIYLWRSILFPSENHFTLVKI